MSDAASAGGPDDYRCDPGWTVADLIEELGRSERTIRRWIATYDIQPVRRGRVYAYRLIDLIIAERHADEARTESRFPSRGVA